MKSNYRVLTCSSTTFCCINQDNIPDPDTNPRACCNSSSQVFTAGFAAYLAGPSIQTPVPTSTCLGWRCTRTATASTTTRYTYPPYRPTSTARKGSSSSGSIDSTRNTAIGVICGCFVAVVLLCILGSALGDRKKEQRALAQVQVQVHVGGINQGAGNREGEDRSPPSYEAVMANRA